MDLNSLNSGKKLIQQLLDQKNNSNDSQKQLKELDQLKNYKAPNKNK
jgi:hypothetical protein